MCSLEILGNTQRQKNNWISAKTLQLIDQRSSFDPQSAQYKELRKQVNQSARQDHQEMWDQVTEEMEQASRNGDSRKLYQLIRHSTKSNTQVSENIQDSHGTMITDLSLRTERWKEHFQTLLNHPPPDSLDPTLTSLPPSSSEEYDVSTDPPTLAEVISAIRKLKNGKAPGEDGLKPEIFKSCSESIAPEILKIIQGIWTTEHIPQDWSDSVILPFYKKNDKTVCKNYRGISLIDICAKIFTSILLNRFKAIRDSRTRRNQGGFRAGKGCVDQIFTLRELLAHRWIYQQHTYICFVDFSSAFDSLHRDSLWNIMLLDGLPHKLTSLIKSYYANTRAKIRIYSEE